MSITVPVDTTSLLIRTTIETVAGLLLMWLVITRGKWASLFLELAIFFAVVDRTFLLLGRYAFFSHDIFTTASSIMILITVITRILEDELTRRRLVKLLRINIEKEIRAANTVLHDQSREATHPRGLDEEGK
jgi:hypothetical protein